MPPGFGGQKDSFEEKYGAPDADKAKALLEAAGVKTPVKITLGYTPTHYGPNAVDEANEFADQLNQSGLFEVELADAEWEEYQTLYKEGAYDLFILGWYPDILDADNYLTPFIRDGGFFENGYTNEEVNTLLDAELAETDTGGPRGADRSAPGHRGRGRPAHPVVERAERRDHDRRDRPGSRRPSTRRTSSGSGGSARPSDAATALGDSLTDGGGRRI